MCFHSYPDGEGQITHFIYSMLKLWANICINIYVYLIAADYVRVARLAHWGEVLSEGFLLC